MLALLLFLLLYIVVLPFAPGLGSDARYVFTKEELKERRLNTEYQAAFFGNSYHYTAIDLSLLKSKLGLNALHLNSSAQNIRISLITAKEAIREHDLKYVFFEISGPSLVKVNPNNEKHWFFQAKALQETPFSLEKIKYSWDYFPRKVYQKYYLSSLSKNLGKVLNLNNRKDFAFTSKKNNHSESGAYFCYNGYIAKQVKSIEKDVFNKRFYGETHKEKTALFWTEDLLKQMEDFLAYAAQKDVEVILTYGLKLHPSSMDQTVINQLKAQYSNIKYLDLNDHRSDYSLTNASFYNESHYNYPASYQVTTRLIDSVSKWYKLPFKAKEKIDFGLFQLDDFFYNLDDTQDKFFRIEYDEIPPQILDEYTFVVGLYPNDKSLLAKKSQKGNRKSEDFYFNLTKDYISAGKKKIIIKKFESRILKEGLEKIMMYFFKKGDTLRLPSFKIIPN